MTATTGSRILAALAEVRDPELDEPITTLGFVASASLDSDGTASVHLRLPTYFCAPNFAYLMVADAYDSVSALDEVRRAEVVLDDHFAADAINDGVAARAGFAHSFSGEAVGELDELRANFLGKSVLAGTDVVCRPLVAAGATPADLAAATLGDLPRSAALDRLRRRRRELGLPSGDSSPLLLSSDGSPLEEDAVPLHLRKARLTRTSLDANTSICRGMLRHRYDTDGIGESS
ncbi:iron-sulfur cluster assembly protein [Actinoplanes sp. TBRC 11911]|uniref:iron-sulfur cluster assembly protein n=1 Tax=Actinoplanes sp. TBRC 11911 TaxID=2729386 RepID=UPI00145C85F3|nr:iron-sulfur cluster assembly protein [Actinoplanes sp. TBRC 11911]NMO54632.1 iron-sulfur cluster assembly protein [Actinoplanes sp. TBRC 11911]